MDPFNIDWLQKIEFLRETRLLNAVFSLNLPSIESHIKVSGLYLLRITQSICVKRNLSCQMRRNYELRTPNSELRTETLHTLFYFRGPIL